MISIKINHFEFRTLLDYQQYAELLLPPHQYIYIISGRDDQITLKNNILAFKLIHIVPRVLVDMTNFSTSTRILGHDLDFPIGIAPFAVQKVLHLQGQVLVAEQSQRRNTIFTLSCLSSTTTTEIKKVNSRGLKILQIYFMKNPEHTKALVNLAQRQGFKAIIVTVDSQTFGKRRHSQRNKFLHQPKLQLFKQIGLDFNLQDIQKQIKNDVVWEDIQWLKSLTKLKIILKGIMNPKDIPLAEQCGVDAIWVSNHGGRKLDCQLPTILVLPQIRQKIKQLKSKMQIFVDGGVKSGGDVFKCLALGADFVFIGRGFMFSLVRGAQGLKQAFNIIIRQLKDSMIVYGTPSTRQITGELISKYPRVKL